MSNIVILIYRLVFKLHVMKFPLIPNLVNLFFIRLLFGCQIGVGAVLGKNLVLGYGGLGIVIHDRAVIGDNVTIGTGVVIGGSSGIYEVPVIGDNCMIHSGAKIIGPISIGSNSIVGANAVVVDSIPENCLAVGVPAKVKKVGININHYR